MANAVETVFSSKDTGIVDTIDRINKGFPEIVRNSQAAGSGIDLVEAKLRRLTAIAANHNVEISKTDYDALRSKGIPAIERATERIQRAADVQRILTKETERTADANRKVEEAVARIRAQEARTQTIANESSPTTRAPGFAAPNVAAGNAIENATRKIDQATEAQKRFHGATLVGSQLLRQFGVEGTRAIEVLINQFSTMGVTLKDLFKSPTIGYTFLLAGVVAAGEAINHVFSQIRENAEASLKRAEDFARVSRLGLQGGSGQTKNELQELLQIREDVNKFVRAGLYGDAQQLIGDKVGKGFTGDQLNIRIEQARRRAEALGLDTRSEREIAAEKKSNDLIREKVELKQREFAADVQHFNEEDKQRKLEKDAIANIANLRIQLASNPYEKFYIEAKRQQQQFLEQFRNVSPEIKQTGLQLIEQIRAQNVFIENTKRAVQVSDTIKERDTLGIIGGRGRQQQIGQEKTGFLNSQFDNQLEVSRLLGRNIDNAEALWRRVQTITENLTGRTAAEAIEAATRGLSPEQLDAAGVRNARIGALQDVGRFQEEDFRRQQRIRQIEDESRDRLLGASQTAYGQARTPEEKRIAIEAGLNAVRDSNSLSPSQVEAKARLLDQSLSIQLDVLRQQQARESRLEASQDKFTTALEKFAEKFGTSVGILGTATEQIKDGINLNVVTDSPSETKVDLGQGFISTGVNAPINNAGFFDPTPSRSNNY